VLAFPLRVNALADIPWAVTPQKVEAVVRRLAEAARPRKIILFGSYVRGRIHRDSDVDILVVTGAEIENPRRESVRLRDCVDDIDMPMDILVVSEKKFEELKGIPGLIYREANEEGRVAYEQDR
jgi:predicted nucleotidyltransferase